MPVGRKQPHQAVAVLAVIVCCYHNKRRLPPPNADLLWKEKEDSSDKDFDGRTKDMTTTTMRKHAIALLCASNRIDYSSALTDMFHSHLLLTP